MPEDRRRKYQSVTSMPSLQPHIGVPPLKMVLVGDLNDDRIQAAGEEPDPAVENGPESQSAKERVVRKIIAHLKKES